MAEKKELGFIGNLLIGLFAYLGYKGLIWLNVASEPLFFYAYNFEKFGWTASLLRLTIIFGLLALVLNMAVLIFGTKIFKNILKNNPKH